MGKISIIDYSIGRVLMMHQSPLLQLLMLLVVTIDRFSKKKSIELKLNVKAEKEDSSLQVNEVIQRWLVVAVKRQISNLTESTRE
jgi:hypothetical protein